MGLILDAIVGHARPMWGAGWQLRPASARGAQILSLSALWVTSGAVAYGADLAKRCD
jgi:hypothetical protein